MEIEEPACSSTGISLFKVSFFYIFSFKLWKHVSKATVYVICTAILLIRLFVLLIFFVVVLQSAGGPGDTAARSTPEDAAAPHGFIWPGIGRPQSPGWPLRGHPLAHTGFRSGQKKKKTTTLFVCSCRVIDGEIRGTRDSLSTNVKCLGGRHNCFLADVSSEF